MKFGCFRLTPRPAPFRPPAFFGFGFFFGLGFGLGLGFGVVVVERVLVEVEDDVEVG